jgi:hypothetical protein
MTSFDVASIAVSPTQGGSGIKLYAGCRSGGVFRSIDSAQSWMPVNSGLTDLQAWALAAVDSDVFVGTYGSGVFHSTNCGTTWIKVNGLVDTLINVLLIPTGQTGKSNKNVFAGTTNGLFLSTNSGISWTDAGLTGQSVLSLAISGNYLYAGSNGYGIWRRPLSEMFTGVEERNSQHPSGFSLEQKYPNPFNLTTNISFFIGTYSYTSLRIYDLLGREVATLVNENKSPGSYQVKWNAKSYPSGVYFYRLSVMPTDSRYRQIGSFSETKKLLLLR